MLSSHRSFLELRFSSLWQMWHQKRLQQLQRLPGSTRTQCHVNDALAGGLITNHRRCEGPVKAAEWQNGDLPASQDIWYFAWMMATFRDAAGIVAGMTRGFARGSLPGREIWGNSHADEAAKLAITTDIPGFNHMHGHIVQHDAYYCEVLRKFYQFKSEVVVLFQAAFSKISDNSTVPFVDRFYYTNNKQHRTL